jgi:hypothetical protein
MSRETLTSTLLTYSLIILAYTPVNLCLWHIVDSSDYCIHQVRQEEEEKEWGEKS